MKKFLLIFISVLLIGGGIWFALNTQKDEEAAAPSNPKIATQLVDNGEVDGKREFVFTLTNKGTKEVTLEFPTWLEYNVNLELLGVQKTPPKGPTFEHLDLNGQKEEGRTLQLAPNEKIDYRLQINNLTSGSYRIRFDSASGFGEKEELEFTVKE